MLALRLKSVEFPELNITLKRQESFRKGNLVSISHHPRISRSRHALRKNCIGIEVLDSVAFVSNGGLSIPESTQHWDSYTPALASIQTNLFSIGQDADSLVMDQLGAITPLTYIVILGAGLLTSLSPCTLSVLPLTIGYIVGYDKERKDRLPVSASSFALGLATTLAILGFSAATLGKTFGSIGDALPLSVAAVAILMGLNLLEVLQFRLPSAFDTFDSRELALPPALQAYIAGMTFALAASPCSTPVLATLLGYVATTGDPLTGASLLLAYTSGYVSPLLLAAFAAGATKQLMSVRQYSAWITPASGALLLAGGTYSLLSRLITD